MGAVDFSLSPHLIATLKGALPVDVFVETGTFKGDSLANAVEAFAEVHSAELSPEYHAAAAERFRHLPHVDVVLGDSVQFLRGLRDRLQGRAAVYFLDAHWCVAEGTAGELSQCPLLDEIAAIGPLVPESVVLIDDARLFLAPPPAPHDVTHWPSFPQVEAALHAIGADHEIMVVNDVIAFYPKRVRAEIIAYARGHGIDWLRASQSLGENDGLRAKVGELIRQLEEKEEGVNAMVRQLAEKEAGVEQMVRQLDEKEAGVEEMVRQLDEKESAVRDAHTALEKSERERAFLQRMIDENAKVTAGSADQEAMDVQHRLLKDLENKEKVILELRRANTAYRAAFAMFGFVIRPVNKLIGWTVSAFADMAPRLGVLNQHPPRPLAPPPPYWLRTPPNVAPRIAIVTPSYQQGHFLERTIRSVLEQGYPNLQYHVQDGASTDGTREILERYGERLTWKSERDTGQTQAINRGFAHVSGEILAWLNSDDILLPGALAYIADYFATHPDVDVVYGHRLLIDENDRQIGRWMVPRHNDYVLSWADYVPQETMFWRRRIWEKVGERVDESFRFAMDWDLLVRFRDADARFVRVPRFLGGFRIHPQQKTSAAINDIGFAEMNRIRERALGRVPTQREVGKAVLPYLIRHIAVDKMWRLRNAFGERA